jgi:NADPH-dependent 2,4-dienoyl-CoA reductase/sulfur reductase-like enzyme/rhodanese-related sulfurtransferase
MGQKIVIIGGVAGGATAAARLRRLDEFAQIVLFERGEHISFANCGLPYYIGGVIKKRDDLFLTTPKDFGRRYNIDIRVNAEVRSIDRKGRKLEVKNLKTGKTYEESYDKVILSPGAEPLRPPIPGVDLENIFSLRNIADTDRIKAYVENAKPVSAVIVGGGYIGIEMVENLRHCGIKTTIVEMLEQVLPTFDPEMAALVQSHLVEKGVACELGRAVTGFTKNGQGLMVSTDKGDPLECDMVILSVGVRPESDLAKEAGLEIGETGGIRVDNYMRTSDPHIFAVGDAVEVREFVTGRRMMSALAGPANKQGRIAADNVMGRKSRFKGTMGTSIIKAFELTAASTGLNEKALLKEKIPYQVSYTHSDSHAGYYPGSQMMSIKLLFSPAGGKVLGAQIVGMDGVDKRIDVLSTAIKGSMTVYDLEELELAYAPPYSSAKDPINMAGFVAANILKGDMAAVHWHELGKMVDDRDALIDMRTPMELKMTGSIDGAVPIPIDELRERLDDLDKDRSYIPYCAVGMRAYLGHRILVQHGFDSKNLSGGYVTYLSTKGKGSNGGNRKGPGNE